MTLECKKRNETFINQLITFCLLMYLPLVNIY